MFVLLNTLDLICNSSSFKKATDRVREISIFCHVTRLYFGNKDKINSTILMPK